MKSIINNNLYMLRYIFRYIPIYSMIKILFSIISALLDVALYTYSFKYTIDSLQAKKSFLEILPFLLGLLIITLLFNYAKKLFENHFIPIASEKLSREMQLELYKKAIDVDIACYDIPEYYNRFVVAGENANQKAMSVLETTTDLFTQLFAIGGYFAIIISLDVIGIGFAAISFILGIVTNITINKISFKRDIELKPFIRKRDYTGRIFYLTEYAKEIRLSNIKKPLINNFKTATNDIIKKNKAYASKVILLRLVNYLGTGFVTNAVYLIILLYKTVVLNILTLGSFTALYLCMDKLGYWLPTLLSTITNFQNHSLFIDKFKEFINYENKVKNYGKLELPQELYSIKVSHLDFRYYGNVENVLSNINVKINPSKKTAIVGYNGAGKSTLVKLLLRLYDPTNGKIELNGVDIREYDLIKYRHSIGTIFQDYHIFSCAINENIAMNVSFDEDKLNYAIIRSGIDKIITSFKNGLDSKIGRELYQDGIQLSGGEMQKLALSRLFYHNYSYLILDEPSASLDPISEYDLYQALQNQQTDKIMIFISHRLSTTRDADKIVMLSNGHVVEQGTHLDLIKNSGEYSKVFQLQAKKYRLTKSDFDSD